MRNFLPQQHVIAHDLAFLFHDVILQAARSASRKGLFDLQIPLNEDDPPPPEDTEDLWDWLMANRAEAAYAVAARTSLSGLLSDFCHFVYEALSCLRKAKLTVGYALLRKPLLETLFLLEEMLLNERRFVKRLASNPVKVTYSTVSGCSKHADRLRRILALLPRGDDYDADFIAQLRYDKSSPDSFNAIWQKALHLITDRTEYATEPLNINFVFSGWPEWETQWAYAYARLPYLLCYMRDVVELLFDRIAPTTPTYLRLIQKRADAGTLLWANALDEEYGHPAIDSLARAAERRLRDACALQGRSPTLDPGWLHHCFYENTWPHQHFRTLYDRTLRAFDGAERLLRDILRSVIGPSR